MAEQTDDEYRDWKDLLASPGWARLITYKDEQLSSKRIEELVTKVLDGDDETTLTQLRNITAGKRWVQAILAHPRMRIATLKPEEGKTLEIHMGRRGAL